MPADLPTLQRSPMPRQRLSLNGRYGISCPVRGSVRLDASELDHLRPLLGFVGDQLSKVGGRARQRRTTRIGKGCVDLVVELVNDLGGGALLPVLIYSIDETVPGK